MPRVSEQQLAQIKEFVNTFPEEEREAKLQEVMAELEGEQEKKPQCPFCLMTEGKINTYKVYEDEKIMGVLEINPVNPGHILLFPKTHISSLKGADPETVESLLKIAQVLSDVLLSFAEGANVLFSEGSVAGQRFPHYIVQIMPRFKGDAVRIEWQGKPLGEKELAMLREKIMGAIASLAKPKEVKQEVPVDSSKTKEQLTRQRKRKP